MKIHPFTRPTIIASIEFLAEVLSQARFDQLLVRLELDDDIALGLAKSVTAKSALMARMVSQRATRPTSTVAGQMTLAEAVVREAVGATIPQNTKAEQDRFVRGLTLDGYVVSWDADTSVPLLRAALPEAADLPAADDEVHQLLGQFGFNVPLGHLDQAISAHVRGDWAAANSQIRTYLEGLISAIAAHIDPQQAVELRSAENCRAWLTERGFLSSSRSEWSSDGKNYLNGLFKMLHSDGSHPGLSDEDHCTFRLHLGLITSRVLLRRLANNS